MDQTIMKIKYDTTSQHTYRHTSWAKPFIPVEVNTFLWFSHIYLRVH